MASLEINKLDRLDSKKLRTWLMTISSDRLAWEYQALRQKFRKVKLVLWGNFLSACFTVPVTVGIAAIWHVATHCWAQTKYVAYKSQPPTFEAELRRRGMNVKS